MSVQDRWLRKGRNREVRREGRHAYRKDRLSVAVNQMLSNILVVLRSAALTIGYVECESKPTCL